MPATTTVVTDLLQSAPTSGKAVGGASAQAAALIEAIDTVLHARRDAVYVSTPITTGPGLVAWWTDNIDRGLGTRAEISRVRADMVSRNIRAVRPLVARVEASYDLPVIDPTRLDSIPGWEQRDYHRFWIEVLRRFVSTVVFADGWPFSSGCALEFAAAAQAGLTLLDAELAPLTVDDGEAMLRDAADELDMAGLDVQAHHEAIRTLHGLAH